MKNRFPTSSHDSPLSLGRFLASFPLFEIFPRALLLGDLISTQFNVCRHFKHSKARSYSSGCESCNEILVHTSPVKRWSEAWWSGAALQTFFFAILSDWCVAQSWWFVYSCLHFSSFFLRDVCMISECALHLFLGTWTVSYFSVFPHVRRKRWEFRFLPERNARKEDGNDGRRGDERWFDHIFWFDIPNHAFHRSSSPLSR